MEEKRGRVKEETRADNKLCFAKKFSQNDNRRTDTRTDPIIDGRTNGRKHPVIQWSKDTGNEITTFTCDWFPAY